MSKAKPRYRRPNPALPPAVPNLFQVTLFGSCEGANTANTFFYADGGAALVPGTEFNLLTGWVTAFMTAYRACMSADWLCTSIKVQCLTSPARIPVQSVISLNGTGPSGHEPMTVAATLVRQTGVKGQAGRGRISLPAVPTSWVTASKVTTFTAYNAFATDVATGFVASGVTYVAQLVSKKNVAGPTLGASPILLAVADPVLGSARKRKINR